LRGRRNRRRRACTLPRRSSEARLVLANIGRARSRGAEFSAPGRLTGRIDAGLTYSYTDAPQPARASSSSAASALRFRLRPRPAGHHPAPPDRPWTATREGILRAFPSAESRTMPTLPLTPTCRWTWAASPPFPQDRELHREPDRRPLRTAARRSASTSERPVRRLRRPYPTSTATVPSASVTGGYPFQPLICDTRT
jgi:outer membrane receptor protein involved in Fe transport